MPGPFGQPSAGPVDLGLDIGAGYQQNAATKLEQARVQGRKSYTSGYAKKYGVSDAAKATKGLSDTDIYELATNLVTKRRGPAKPATPATPAKPAAPRVTQKTSTKPRTTAKTTTRRKRRTTVRRRTTRATTTRTTTTAPSRVTLARNTAIASRLL